MKKRNYFWFVLALIPIILFIIFAIQYINNSKANWLDLSIGCATSFASIFLGVMVYIQSEKHKADTNKLTEQQQRQEDIYKMEEGKYREQDVLIRTCPAIYFEKIDYVSKPSSDLPINFTTSNLLKINFETSKIGAKQLKSIIYYNDFNEYVLFKFVFTTPEYRGLNKIVIHQATIETDYFENIPRLKYSFFNYSNFNDETNISYLGDNKYMVNTYFVFPKSENISDLFYAKLYDRDKFSLCIDYAAYNYFGVVMSGSLKVVIKTVYDKQGRHIIGYEDVYYTLNKPFIVKQ